MIEACGTRCRVPDATSFQRVADGGIGSHVVLGPTMNAAAAKAAKLGGVEIEVSVNGKVAVEGSGFNVFEDPINSLCFLATEIGLYGHTIKKGDFVITGATCILPPTDYEEGDQIVANFKGLGSVTMTTGGAAKL